MTTLTRSLALAAATMLCSSVAQAQQYRVELVLAGGMATHADFRRCPSGAASADCGTAVARITRSTGTLYGLTTRAVSSNGHDSVTVENGKLRIKTLDGRTPAVVLLGIGSGTVEGVVISPDSHYAFAVVQNKSGNPSDVMMIDLATQNGVAGVSLDSRVVGLAMGR
ncbi:MAG TPA: hypothetical protein VGM67_11210 [Gemmatimonadaceae bacterium]|jgi:hypothetical protein